MALTPDLPRNLLIIWSTALTLSSLRRRFALFSNSADAPRWRFHLEHLPRLGERPRQRQLRRSRTEIYVGQPGDTQVRRIVERPQPPARPQLPTQGLHPGLTC